MSTAPSKMDFVWESIRPKSKKLMRNPRKMASPPNRGMGTLCIRRASRGTSMAPTFLANIFTTGVRAKLSASATLKAKNDVMRTLLSIMIFVPRSAAPGAPFLAILFCVLCVCLRHRARPTPVNRQYHWQGRELSTFVISTISIASKPHLFGFAKKPTFLYTFSRVRSARRAAWKAPSVYTCSK